MAHHAFIQRTAVSESVNNRDVQDLTLIDVFYRPRLWRHALRHPIEWKADMPTATDSQRFEPEDMIAATPFVDDNQLLTNAVFTVAPFLVANTLLAYLLEALWRPLTPVAAVTLVISAYLWWADVAHFVARQRAGVPLEEARQGVVTWRGHVKEQSQPSGIAMPSWIYPKKTYDDHLPPKRRGQPRVFPDVDFKLCIARHHSNGSTSQIAYSDGTAPAWNPRANALCRAYRPGWAGPAGGRPGEAARILESMTELAAQEAGTTVGNLIEQHSGRDSNAILHALRTAVMWGLLEPDRQSSGPHLYTALSTPDLPKSADLFVRTTPAGVLWLKCSRKALAEEHRRKRMESARKAEFHGPTQGVHIGDHSATPSTTRSSTSWLNRLRVRPNRLLSISA